MKAFGVPLKPATQSEYFCSSGHPMASELAVCKQCISLSVLENEGCSLSMSTKPTFGKRDSKPSLWVRFCESMALGHARSVTKHARSVTKWIDRALWAIDRQVEQELRAKEGRDWDGDICS